MKKAFVVMSLSLMAVACSSGPAIKSDDHGFTILQNLDSAFTARYESERAANRDDAMRSFLFHAAKSVIDRGGVYMRVDGMTTEASTLLGRKDSNDPLSPEASPADPQDPQKGVTNPGTDPSYSSRVTISREQVAEGQVRYWKEKPPGIVTHEATRVMELARDGELPKF
jgi:hypothetical protein